MHDALIVFTRFPQAGKAKTRLIPALGAEGSADLQRQMTRQMTGRAWAFCVTTRTRLSIAYEGGDERQMRAWLGPLKFVPQGEGSLGERMHRTVVRAMADGAQKAVIIGSDCPALDEARLAEAFAALDRADVVFGPAEDGGYYLVGMKQAHKALFDEMPWGGSEVLALSLARARQCGLHTAQLAMLPDVDEPKDVSQARAALEQGRTLSVIIPALNEAATLAELLPDVRAAGPLEIIVADGGSTDDTITVAERYDARVVDSECGRARQMNAAALHARGEFLLFLHADTTPPPEFPRLIAETLTPPGVAAGAFRFALREPIPLRGLIESLVALRCAALQTPYGDQGLFLRRSLFHSMNGFPVQPILEDVDFVRQLRRIGRVITTTQPAPTSARRWQQGGVLRTYLRHQLILLGHACGIAPQTLAKLR